MQLCSARISYLFFFFFNDTATTEIYTLSLHDALPIFYSHWFRDVPNHHRHTKQTKVRQDKHTHKRSCRHYGLKNLLFSSCKDRKSTRLNSSHANISYAVFCLKKKKPPPSPSQFRQQKT